MPWFRRKDTGEIKEITDNSRIEALRSDPDAFEEVQGIVVGAQREPINLPSEGGPSGMTQGEAALRMLGKGAALSFSDELMGAGRAAGDWLAQQTQDLGYTPTPRDYIEEERAKDIEAQEKLGTIPATALEGAGVMATPIPGGRKLRSSGVAGRLGEAALVGGAYGLGSSEDKSFIDALAGAGAGLLFGGAGEVMAAVPKLLYRRAKKLEQRLFPKSPTETEKDIFTLRAKADVGPSREEIAAKKLKELRSRRDIMEDDIKATNDLIAEHGSKVKQSLQDDINANVVNNLNNVKKSVSIVLDEAHTGLKGDMAKRYFGDHLASLSDADRINALSTASKYTNYILDNAEALVDDIIDSAGKGLIKAPGADIKQYKKAISHYRSVVRDIDKQTTGFTTMYGKKKYKEPPKFMAENLQTMYIALDNMKRTLGKIHDNRSIGRATKEKIEELYEKSFKEPLVDPKLWGPEVSEAQRELNELWYRHLKLDPAVERRMFQSKGMQTQTAENPWETYGEAEWAAVKRLTTNPDGAENAMAMRDFNDWLDTVYGLSGTVVKHYKPTEKLVGEVSNIAKSRDAIRRQLDHAREDYRRFERVGVSPKQRALDDAKVAAARLSPSENVREIDRLRSEVENKSLRKADIGREERTLTEREIDATSDPELMRQRLESDREYQRKLAEKTEAYRDIERTPLQRLGVKGGRILGKELSGSRGRVFGAVGGEYSDDIISQMWGDRPISTVPTDETGNAQKEVLLQQNQERYKKQKERMGTF